MHGFAGHHGKAAGAKRRFRHAVHPGEHVATDHHQLFFCAVIVRGTTHPEGAPRRKVDAPLSGSPFSRATLRHAGSPSKTRLALASGVTIPRLEICSCPRDDAATATNRAINATTPRSDFVVLPEMPFIFFISASTKSSDDNSDYVQIITH